MKLKIKKKTKSNQFPSEEENRSQDGRKKNLPRKRRKKLLAEYFCVLIQASKASSLPDNGAKNLMDQILNSLVRTPKT